LVNAAQLRELMDVALSSLGERALPFSVWSVPNLAAYCREHDLIPRFCNQWVRRLLRGAVMRAQRIRTWKTSHDPAFERNKAIPPPHATGPPRTAVMCLSVTTPFPPS